MVILQAWTQNLLVLDDCENNVDVTLRKWSKQVKRKEKMSTTAMERQHEMDYNEEEEEEEEDEEEDEDEGEEEEDHIEKMTEIRFIPTCSDDLENIYAAICECQTLYPDPELSDDSEEEIIERQENGGWDDDEDEDEGGVFYTSAEEGLPHLSAEGRAVLEHLENVFQLPAPEEFSRMINGDQNGVMEQFEDLSDEMDDV